MSYGTPIVDLRIPVVFKQTILLYKKMLKERIGAVSLLIVVAVSTSAQQRADVSGKLEDGKSNPINGATVYLLNTNYATVSNDSGRFILKDVPVGNYVMQVHAIGFSSIGININLTESTGENLQIILPDEANQLDDVVVSAEKKDESLQKIAGSITSFSSAQVQQYRLWNSK